METRRTFQSKHVEIWWRTWHTALVNTSLSLNVYQQDVLWAHAGRSLRSFIDVSVYSTCLAGKIIQRRKVTSWTRSSSASWPRDLSQECVRGSVWKNKGRTPTREVKIRRKWDTGHLKMICWEETAFSCRTWEMSRILQTDGWKCAERAVRSLQEPSGELHKEESKIWAVC